jgi:hypothetical protein
MSAMNTLPPLKSGAASLDSVYRDAYPGTAMASTESLAGRTIAQVSARRHVMRVLDLPLKPFGVRRGKDGAWEVFDRRSKAPVVCDCRLMTGLSLEEADMVMDILNGDHPFCHIITVH